MQKKYYGFSKQNIADMLKKHGIKVTENENDKSFEKKMALLDLSRKYHENSKITRENASLIELLESLFSSAEMIKMRANIFLDFSDTDEIILPNVNLDIDRSFYECVSFRRSCRGFTGEAIDLNVLSSLLWHSYGITGMQKLRERETNEEIIQYLRAIPSGGALYPIELYVVILNVDGVSTGLYYYNVKRHSLQLLKKSDSFVDDFRKTFTMSREIFDISTGSVIFVMTASFWKQNAKYGSRGYRFALMEAGHMGQNIQLASTGLELGSLCVGGFYDDEICNQINVDVVEDPVIYTVVVGVPKVDTSIKNLKPGESRD